jgi:hypothetical protein
MADAITSTSTTFPSAKPASGATGSVTTAAKTPATATATRPAQSSESPAPPVSPAQPKAPRAVEPPAPVVPDVSADLSRLIETYLAVCYSVYQDEHRETCSALAASWKRRAERERQFRRPDYRTEILALVQEVEAHIKGMGGDSPPFVLEYLRKRADEDTRSLKNALQA